MSEQGDMFIQNGGAQSIYTKFDQHTDCESDKRPTYDWHTNLYLYIEPNEQCHHANNCPE